jgi:hypothetical protein
VIVGTVYNAITKAKIQTAKVQLLDVLCATVLMTTYTDAQGKYAFPAIDGPETYCIDVDK